MTHTCKCCGKSGKQVKFRYRYRRGEMTNIPYSICNSCMYGNELKKKMNIKVPIKIQIDNYFKEKYQAGR